MVDYINQKSGLITRVRMVLSESMIATLGEGGGECRSGYEWCLGFEECFI